MPKRGLLPRRHKLKELLPSKRRYSYSRTFGTTLPAHILDFLIDPIDIRRNQNISDDYFTNPPLPNGCTGFAVSGIAEADLKARVNPRFTYDKTLIIQNGQEGDECTLQDAFKSALVYGVQLRGETDQEALGNRRGPYFEVHPDSNHDWFDALLSAVFTNQRPVAVGTTWPIFFENIGPDGVQTYKPSSWVGGHAHNFIGKKTINGVEYLVDDSWNGAQWGDNGLCYFSRDVVNAMMKIQGSDALTNRPALPGDIQIVKITIIQVLISLYYRLLAWRG